MHLLEEQNYHLPREELSRLLDEAEGFDAPSKNMDLQIEAVADCWREVWGNSFPRRAFIHRHDDELSYDLNLGIWVTDDDDKWTFE